LTRDVRGAKLHPNAIRTAPATQPAAPNDRGVRRRVRVKAHVHYEAAFEDYLRARQIAYVSVDESNRAIFREARLKSFDFIVYSARTTNWLADVKGRRFACRRGNGHGTWENWVTSADLDGLGRWQEVFGPDFRGLLVFAYWLDPAAAPPDELVHRFRNQRYIFAGVPLDEYELNARVRSPKWGTVNLRKADFVHHVRPLADWL
jgi:hypothetical protein